MLGQLSIGLLDLSTYDFQRLWIRLQLPVLRLLWTLPYIAIISAFGDFNGLDIGHRSGCIVALGSNLIFHVFVSDGTRFSSVAWRWFLPVRSALVLELLDFILDSLLMAAYQFFILLRAQEAIVVFVARSWLLLGEATWLKLRMQWLCLVYLRSLLCSVGWHWLSESRTRNIVRVLIRVAEHWIVLVFFIVVDCDWTVITNLGWNMLVWPSVWSRWRLVRSRNILRPLRFNIRSHTSILIAEWVWFAHSGVYVLILKRGPLRVILLFVALDPLSWRSLLLGRTDSEHSASSASWWRCSHWGELLFFVHGVAVSALSRELSFSLMALIEHTLILLILILSKGTALTALAHWTLIDKLRHLRYIQCTFLRF